jgi:hypothetical protein
MGRFGLIENSLETKEFHISPTIQLLHRYSQQEKELKKEKASRVNSSPKQSSPSIIRQQESLHFIRKLTQSTPSPHKKREKEIHKSVLVSF